MPTPARPTAGKGSNQYQQKGGGTALKERAGNDAQRAAHAAVTGDSEQTDPRQPCSECGTPTLRPDGVCKKCRRSPGSGGDATPRRDRPKSRRSQRNHQDVDTSAGPVSEEEVGCCSFEFVPVTSYGGTKATISGAQTRSCKNAVRLPEQFCHAHGGSPENSFGGKTFAKAQAEAARGELYPPSAAHWEQAEMRVEALQGQIAKMMQEDPQRMASLWADLVKQKRKDGTQRFSTGNQMLVLFQHANLFKKENPESTADEQFAYALERVRQPHMTVKAWAKEGRSPVDDAAGVVVMHFKPMEWLEREAGETDEEWEERLRKARGHMTPHLQYPLDQTDGDPYEEAADPYEVVLPRGHGDANAAYAELHRYATERGYKVEMTDDWPGAYGYWNASENKIVVWTGVGGGSMAARLHVFAHEVGHAELGHGTDAGLENTRPDKEAGAESFAYLVCARFGIDTTELSADYVQQWQKDHGVNMEAASSGSFMSAAKAADIVFTNIPVAEPPTAA